MSIYLPIAELPINILLLLGFGMLGGILAGMFGVGGGFLLTPLLMFIGIPPAVAVATSSNQIVASSLSGFLAHWYRKNVDIKMGVYLLLGGAVGAVFGVGIFAWLQTLGQIDLVISLIYVIFLGVIGTMMLFESVREIRKTEAQKADPTCKVHFAKRVNWPWRVEFPRSKIKISILFPLLVGGVAGILVSVMGIGGGFVTIPAMIYLLGMPTSVVIGTSLFQIVFVTALVTILHAVGTQSVDIMLAFLLIVGGVIGAQFGTILGAKLPSEKLRGLLAIIVLSVCAKLALDLVIEPYDLFSVVRK